MPYILRIESSNNGQIIKAYIFREGAKESIACKSFDNHLAAIKWFKEFLKGKENEN
jgi:hypothetical protein